MSEEHVFSRWRNEYIEEWAKLFYYPPKFLLFKAGISIAKTVVMYYFAVQGRRIVITHRLSTIKQSDRIIVLDGGKLVEDGIDKKGFFYELVERQRLE